MKGKYIYGLSVFLVFSSSVVLAGSLTDRVFSSVIVQQLEQQQAEQQQMLSEKNNITVYTIGTGTPMSQVRAYSGTAVIANGHFFMFDVGPGVVKQAEAINLPVTQLEAVFLTHFHADHYFELPYLINRTWTMGRNRDLTVFGAKGVTGIVNAANQFAELENISRIEHHGSDIMNKTYSVGLANEFSLNNHFKRVVYNNDGIKISAFRVNHDPADPAVGYVIEYSGKKVVLSGDTKKNENVLKMAKGADLLIHEVMLKDFVQRLVDANESLGRERDVRVLTDIQEYHTSPNEVADLAQQAGVKKLVLNHMAPDTDMDAVKVLYKRKMRAYKGEMIFAEDGEKFVVE